MARKKTNGVYFVISPEESALFEKRMEQTGIRNRSAYIRKMCIDGHVFRYDSEKINEIGRLLRMTANNVNQIARRVNTGGTAYRNDVEEVNCQLTEIRRNFGELMALLGKVADPRPGKRFVPPPRASDETGGFNRPTAEGRW